MVHGLRNVGNSCYLNSTVQALKATLHKVPDELRDLFARMDTETTDCSELQASLAKQYPPIGTREQQDAQELLTILLDTIPCEDVSGALTSTVRCTCGYTNDSAENFSHLSLPLKRSVGDSLDSFFEDETIEMRCTKCDAPKCTLSSKLTTWPRSLILHLKRFAYEQERSPRNASQGRRLSGKEQSPRRASPGRRLSGASGMPLGCGTRDCSMRGGTSVVPPNTLVARNDSRCSMQVEPRVESFSSTSPPLPMDVDAGTVCDSTQLSLTGVAQPALGELLAPLEWSAQEAVLQLLVRLMSNVHKGDKFCSIRADSKALSVIQSHNLRVDVLRSVRWAYADDKFTFPADKLHDAEGIVESLHALGTAFKRAHLRRERDAGIAAYKESRLPTGGPALQRWGRIRQRPKPHGTGQSTKLEYPTTVPFEWNLRPGESPAPYELVAVVIHIGSSLLSGHYVALCCIDGQWFRCNDSVVTHAVIDDVRREATLGYLFFYRSKA